MVLPSAKMKVKPKSQRFSLKSFVYAFKGLKHLFVSQPNAQFHLIAASVVVGAGFYFSINSLEWVALFICIGGVITAEAFNTAIEELVDLVHPDWNDKAGLVKDLAAGAVLFFSLISIIIAMLIFLPKVLSLF